MKSSLLMKIFCIIVPSVYTCQYGPFAMKMLSQTLSFSEKLRALKSFFINTYIKVLFCGQKYPPFSGHWSVSSFIGQKKARISGRY
jgi:hypothetical protein